ncbi:MAG: alpha/beta-hydrolase family protein [Microbacterium sp.]
MGDAADETGATPATRRRWWMLDPLGSLLGFTLSVLSVTPSLVPRPAVMQGAVAALAFAVGYLVGAAVWVLVRRLLGVRVPGRGSPLFWVLFSVVWLGAFALLAERATAWQDEVRALVEMRPLGGPDLGAFAAGFLPLVVLLLTIGRGVRRMYTGLRRTIGTPLAAGGSGLIVIAGTTAVLMITMAVLDGVYLGRNGAPDADAVEPPSAYRSAGPGSAISWDHLGRHGANFVGGGPSAAEITVLTGVEAKQPIRVYAGVASAESLKERASLVVDELERTGAFDRRVLVVATTTGSGWLEAQTVDALEYLLAGDTAIAAMQYSYLPSWASSVFDPELPQDAARILFDAVSEAWRSRPEGDRPLLISYGLSLGALGAQSVFADLDDLRARTDGAMFVGSPNGATLWRSLQAARDEGSPAWRPVLDRGSEVRWISRAGDEKLLTGPWREPRVLYLQHATDAVTWLAPELLWRSPDWLEPAQRGADVSPSMRWIPVVTAMQVLVDMLVGEAVPARHGHNFGDVVLTGWREVVGDPGLSEAGFARVQTEIESYAPIPPGDE